MIEIFYVDLYFVTNFLMDLVSLGVGALSASRKVTVGRLLTASLFGAAFSTAVVLLRAGRLLTVLFSFVAFALMIVLCFGIRNPKMLWKPALFSFSGAVFLGGAAHFLSYYLLPRGSEARLGFAVLCGTVFLGVCAYSLWGSHMNRKLDTAVVSLNISFCGKCQHYYGLVDSGLLLRDPELGRPILLLKAEYAAPLLPKGFLARMEKGELSSGEKMICVPIRSVGGEGLLYAFLPERVQVVCRRKSRRKREERDVLVALDFSGGGYGGCPCLVPLSVV